MKSRISAALLFVILIGTVSIYYAFKPITVQGIVERKAITGKKEDVFYTILLITDIGISATKEDYYRYFSKFNIVTKSLEDEIKSEYVDIRYLVSIETLPSPTRPHSRHLAHFVSREDFNKVDVTDLVTYEVSRFKETAIRRIIGAIKRLEG